MILQNQKGTMPVDNVITIPYNMTPRVYQQELMAALDMGYKRALVVYHRRAG